MTNFAIRQAMIDNCTSENQTHLDEKISRPICSADKGPCSEVVFSSLSVLNKPSPGKKLVLPKDKSSTMLSWDGLFSGETQKFGWWRVGSILLETAIVVVDVWRLQATLLTIRAVIAMMAQLSRLCSVPPRLASWKKIWWFERGNGSQISIDGKW